MEQNIRNFEPLHYVLKGESIAKHHERSLSMSGHTTESNLAEIVTQNLRAAKVFERYEIDYYCNGNRSLREACDANGTDVEQLISELREIDEQSETDFDSMSIANLIVYIVDTHHAYMKKLLPDISQRFHKIEELEGPLPSDAIALIHAFHEVKVDLVAHTASEENEVFPHINKLYDLSKSGGRDSSSQSGALNTQIYLMENEHMNARDGVSLLRSLSGDFTADDAEDTATAELYKQLQALYYDVHIHIHMENNILHPRALQLEKSLL